jgi:hypothetical protein
MAKIQTTIGVIDIWSERSTASAALLECDEYRALYPKACYAIDSVQVGPSRFVIGANQDQPRQARLLRM